MSMPTTAGSRTVPLDALHRFCVDAFRSTGMSEADARVGADVLVTTDAWGVLTHGTKSLAGYLKRLQAGGLKPAGRPAVVREGPAWALVDGDSALGMVTSTQAMRVAIAKARAAGIGYVGVRNSCHFGAAGYYASLAAAEGFIGIGVANDIPSVASPGSRGSVTGSNPFSYAIPAGRHRPILLDMAISTVAGGKVYAARARGEPIPAGWIVDGDGRPTTDPSGFPERGALTPMAGHKGFGLALLVEALSALITGAAVTWQVGSWSFDDPSQHTRHGAGFLAIDCSLIQPVDEFRRRVDALIDEIHEAPRAPGVDRLWVPGEMEWERQARAEQDGVSLPVDVVENLRRASALTGVPLPPALRTT